MEDQCPARGPGLKCQYGDTTDCEFCLRSRAEGLFEKMRRATGKRAPNVVKLTGETEPPDELDRGLNGLTAKQWHALIVERKYREDHPSPDDQP